MTTPRRVLLGGGIGSGKSTAAGFLTELGAAVFSADAAGHRVLEPGESAFGEIAAQWPEVVDTGHIDRSALGRIVFSDRAALDRLEAITHPAIREEITREIAGCDAAVVVVEIPLPIDLLGTGWRWVVVDAPDAVRVSRLRDRGMDPFAIAQRMAAQPTRREWLRRADLVISNAGGLDALAAECRRVWTLLTRD